MPPRQRKYGKYTSETKQNLIDAINRGDTMKNACLTLKIAVRTGHKIYEKYRMNGELVPNLQRGGYKMRTFTHEQIQQIRTWIDEDCTLSLSELKGRVLWHMLEDISESTIANYIKGFHYTFKRVAKIANAADTPRLWDDRLLYCQWYSQQKVLGKTFIYLDEVGFQVVMRLSRGRAAVGVTPQVKAPGIIRSRNITVMAAMATLGNL